MPPVSDPDFIPRVTAILADLRQPERHALPRLAERDDEPALLDHLTRLAKLKGESVAVREFRGLAPHYLRGTAGAAKIRGAVAKAESIQEVEALFDQALQR